MPREYIANCALSRVSTPPEEIAARISVLVDEMNQRVPMAWEELRSNREWRGTEEEKTQIVRQNASRAATGKPNPTDGYGLVLSADATGTTFVIGVDVGSRFVGRKLPAQNIDASVRARAGCASIDPRFADALFESVVIAWEPLMCDLSSSEIVSATRAHLGGKGRGGWKISTGYRVWLRDGTVAVNEVAEGVERRSFAGGTLLSVPFEWPAADVARAMLKTLEMNGLDEMPHPVP